MTTSALPLSNQLLVGELLRRAAHKTPDNESFICENTRATYSQMEGRAVRLAGWLQEQGIGHDDKVAFILKNGLPFVETFFGVALSGGVGVPINFRLSPREIKYIMNNSDAQILIIDQEYVETVDAIRSELPEVKKIVVVGEDDARSDTIAYESIFKTPTSYSPCKQLCDDDASMIVYTSGTTGRPKGAVLTHKNLYQNGQNMVWEFALKRGVKQLIVAPLFHVAALSTLVNHCLVNGTSVIHREFEPVRILEAIEKESINVMFLVPSMWNFLVQVPNVKTYDLSSLSIGITGGAICPLKVKRKIMDCFPEAGIYDVFGQTEMSPCTTCLHPEDTLRKAASVGKPIMNVEVRVVDDEMNDVPAGEIGEIVYRGPTLMKEYYRNRKETEAVFKGGWFHSGDLVKTDEEGFIYVIDRKKDMVISGGENIYPAEVEEVLYTHPAILENAVIGVPDEDWGEKVKAFVVLKPGQEATGEEIIAHCSKYLASYKKPKVIEFLDELPRNAAGKVLKQVLRKFSASGESYSGEKGRA